jgi:hypothetical protein
MESFNVTSDSSTTSRKVKILKNHDFPHGHAHWTLTPEHRHALISVAAYYLSEKSGFKKELTEQCWHDAEKQISSNFAQHLN